MLIAEKAASAPGSLVTRCNWYENPVIQSRNFQVTVDMFLFSYLPPRSFHQAYSILADCSFGVHVKHQYYLVYANKRMTLA